MLEDAGEKAGLARSETDLPGFNSAQAEETGKHFGVFGNECKRLNRQSFRLISCSR